MPPERKILKNNSTFRRLGPLWLAITSAVILVPAWLAADWYSTVPDVAPRRFVGRQSCIACHTEQFHRWQGSHHDLAMDPATPETVLGDFDDATLEHFGIVSRMFRDKDEFKVRTEGPDGEIQEFDIKYVFGVEPLQQYLVEFDRPANMPDQENARLQVLRISWDTQRKRWFYLSPPDVQTKLAPDDPLHWTGRAQNWNHMCADCHSTNLQKNFDVKSRTYHTTFSEIDVSCEACHGPGSLHVELANANSLFWDRKHGYGLRTLKTNGNRAQIESCAPCHSRRSKVSICNGAHESYYDCYENELLQPQTYYADGQIRDEVYVYGSYLQSKMYHKGIKCSDCHDPHTARLIHQGNKVCTSCHQHDPAKYDTPAHHNHPSTEVECVDCHMPATPFMDIDFRRDHSLRVPRPDLSVELETPNACTGCHLDVERLPLAKRDGLNHYSDWLAKRQDESAIRAEVQRVDQWAADAVERWYGAERQPHFGTALKAAWDDAPGAVSRLQQVLQSRDAPAIAQASALRHLAIIDPNSALPHATRLVHHRNPQLRVESIRCFQSFSTSQQNASQLVDVLAPRLTDSVRLVRMEAANVLAALPRQRLSLDEQKAFHAALEEYRKGLLVNADQAGAHLARGVLAERMGSMQRAIQAYETAIHVQPDVPGPRSNLARIVERTDADYAKSLRAEELILLRRDAALVPDTASVQYRYGLALYLNGRPDQALPVLEKAAELDPDNTEYQLSLALLHERLGNLQDALDGIERVIEQRPDDVSLLPIRQRLRQQLRNR